MELDPQTFVDAVQSAIAYRNVTLIDYGVFISKKGKLRVVPINDNPAMCECIFNTNDCQTRFYNLAAVRRFLLDGAQRGVLRSLRDTTWARACKEAFAIWEGTKVFARNDERGVPQLLGRLIEERQEGNQP
jgi:hypothetical protein